LDGGMVRGGGCEGCAITQIAMRWENSEPE
jgi:hypothetical protein